MIFFSEGAHHLEPLEAPHEEAQVALRRVQGGGTIRFGAKNGASFRAILILSWQCSA